MLCIVCTKNGVYAVDRSYLERNDCFAAVKTRGEKQPEKSPRILAVGKFSSARSSCATTSRADCEFV